MDVCKWEGSKAGHQEEYSHEHCGSYLSKRTRVMEVDSHDDIFIKDTKQSSD